MTGQPTFTGRELFVDTGHIIATVSRRDQHHLAALAWSHWVARQAGLRLVTTRFVLLEFLDNFSDLRHREAASQTVRRLAASPQLKVIAASDELYDRGLDLFEKRPDKEWSLTDCSSFVVMQDRKINAALAADRHFSQAGVDPLLRRYP